MFKKLGIGLIGIAIAGTVPVVPEDMEWAYSYQTVPSAAQPSATSTPQSQPFEDEDGNGIVSVAVFMNRDGEMVQVQIDDKKYEKGTKQGGYAERPNKSELVSLVESFTPEANAALSVGNVTSAAVAAAASSLTYAHNNNGNALIVGVSSLTGGAGPTSVTYNAVAMTKEIGATDGVNEVALIYSLASPANGSNNVVVTYGSNRNFGSSATSYLGADTSDVVGATNRTTALTNNTTPTVSVTTTASGSIVQDNVLLLASSTATVGASQTQRTNRQIVSDGFILNSTEPAASPGSVTMSWSLSGGVNWTTAAVEVKGTADAAPPVTSDLIIFD